MVRLTVTLSEDCSTRVIEMVESGQFEDESAALDHLISRGEQVTEIEHRFEDEPAALDHLISRGEQVTEIEHRIERVRDEMQSLFDSAWRLYRTIISR